MSDSKDIIQTALDVIASGSQKARVLVQRPERHAMMWYGRLTGLGSTGDAATITLSDVRASADGDIIPGHARFDVDDVLDITAI